MNCLYSTHLNDSVKGLRLGVQVPRDLHLYGAAAGDEPRVLVDVPGDVERVLQVPLDLVEDVLGGAPQEDGARLGVLATLDEGEVLVADLADLEEAAAGADVGVGDLLGAVDDGGTAGARHPQVVGLSQPPASGQLSLVKFGELRMIFKAGFWHICPELS